jgi:hypothetical protein
VAGIFAAVPLLLVVVPHASAAAPAAVLVGPLRFSRGQMLFLLDATLIEPVRR